MEYSHQIKENGPPPMAVNPVFMPNQHYMPNMPMPNMPMPIAPAMHHMPCHPHPHCHPHHPMMVSPALIHPCGGYGHRDGERQFILIVVLFILLIIVGVSFIR